MSTPADEEPVPRIPRGRGMKLDAGMMFRIGMTLLLLVMIVVMTRPCANATSKFVTGFGSNGSGSSSETMPKPGTVEAPAVEKGSAADYEMIRPDMTDEERRAAIERAKQRERERAARGSGSATGSGSAAAPSSLPQDSVP